MGKTKTQTKTKTKTNHLKGTMNATIRSSFGDDSKTIINAHDLRKFAREYLLTVGRQTAVLAIEETRSTGACLITFESHPLITLSVICEECQE